MRGVRRDLIGRLAGGAVAVFTGAVSPLLRGPSLGVSTGDSLAAPRVLRRGLGVLESVIVDQRGRLFFTSQTWALTRKGLGLGAVLRIDDPDADPVVVATGIGSPGGLAFDDSGCLIVGFGDNPIAGLVGNYSPRAGILSVDPDGRSEPRRWPAKLAMANGIVRAADGTIFASNDVGTHIDRIDPDGHVENRWARVPSANGLAIDREGRTSLRPPDVRLDQISRV
jgi:sugar lactone lactonase YvrE